MSRQKLIHLHGVNTPEATTLTGKGFVAGEIAVKNAAAAKDSELYVLGGDKKLAVFATADVLKAYTDAKIKTATDGLNYGAIAEITNNITAISGDVKTLSGTVTTNYTELDGRLDSVEGILGTPAEGETAATGLVKKVDDIDAAYKAADNAIDERLVALEAIDHDHANKAELDLIQTGDVAKWNAAEQNAKNYAAEEIAKETSARTEAVKEVSDALAEEVSARTKAVTTLEGKIAEAKAAATTKVVEGADNAHLSITSATDESTSAVTYTVTLTDVASDTLLQEVKDNVDTLIGDDADMSAREIVQDEVAKQLTSENISDSFDTLKEMAEWLSSHPEDVQEMNNAISANTSAITAEATARQNADNDLKSKIEAVESKVTGATNDAITTLTANVATISGYVETLKTEMDAAESAITVNANAITAETSARQTAISGLETAYKAADTELSGKITSAETKFANAIASARTDFAKDIDDALASAKTYTDTALASAKTYTDTAISTLTNNKIKEVEDKLSEVEGTANSAVQTVTVSNLKGVTAARSGADVTIDYEDMVIDCGSWE